MPKRTDIQTIMVIGSGPIVIGQAVEFDYSGTQACKALRELGYRIVLVNSNPATIMTDPEFADATYVEPLTVEICEKIIEKERPDVLLPTVGGQTALNLALDLKKAGVLEKYNVGLIGATLESIEVAEDREMFKAVMEEIGLKSPKSKVVGSVAEALEYAEEINYPVLVRPSYTLGGSGGGVAYTPEQLKKIAASGIHQSPVGEVLVDQSLLGWKEYELELMRDGKGKRVVVNKYLSKAMMQDPIMRQMLDSINFDFSKLAKVQLPNYYRHFASGGFLEAAANITPPIINKIVPTNATNTANEANMKRLQEQVNFQNEAITALLQNMNNMVVVNNVTDSNKLLEEEKRIQNTFGLS